MELEQLELIGELALTGAVRSVRGILPAVLQCMRHQRTLILSEANLPEARLVNNAQLYPVDSLLAVCAHLHGQQPLPLTVGEALSVNAQDFLDLSEVHGQHQAKRALTIAAAGAHSLLFYGPPGTGKTMLASRLPGRLPPMEESIALESAALASITGTPFNPRHWRRAPFRAPHHTASGVALVGGASQPRPGEASLAHGGVLFLDELKQFDRRVLDVLREPLESGTITISRAARQAEFPAKLQLIAAMNPCPCGYLGHPSGRCHCSAEQVQRYRSRISGPLMDRIDMQVEVPPLARGTLASDQTGETSETVRSRVLEARDIQLKRAGKPNCFLDNREIKQHCCLQKDDSDMLEQIIEQLGLSARAYHRILRVARTIADLDGKSTIQRSHLTEAVGYRKLDRQ